jgi:hypothetical protein
MSATTCDMERGFIRFVANAYSDDMGVNFQIMESLSRDTALKVLEIIKPEFAGYTFSITQYACEMAELPASKRQHDRLNDALGYVTTCEKPGDALLRLIGYRTQSTEV